MHAENRDRPHRRQQPTSSAPVPAMAGRGRVAGKGPVNAMSTSTGGHLASATPSGTASNTHAGQLGSGGARAPMDARSTLPALVGPNSENAVAGSAGPLATTATVGGVTTATGASDRRVRDSPQNFSELLQPSSRATRFQHALLQSMHHQHP